MKGCFCVRLVFVLLVGLIWSGLPASAADTGKFVVIGRVVVENLIDLGESGESAGDMNTWINDLFNAKETEQVGKCAGRCVRLSSTDSTTECTFVLSMKEGDVVVTALETEKGGPFKGAIVGGTGAYARSRGQVTYRPSQDGSKWSYTLKISK